MILGDTEKVGRRRAFSSIGHSRPGVMRLAGCFSWIGRPRPLIALRWCKGLESACFWHVCEEVGSGRDDSNVRPPAPKAGALTKLSYAPFLIADAVRGKQKPDGQ